MHRELSDIHEALWDPERLMVRLPPGVAPGVDLSELELHSVRETALAAFFDLDGGRVERAAAALREVLALQHELSEWPWSGAFPTTAEQPQPPGTDAIEWVHYDPNWRQFLGCILLLTRLVHGDDLPGDVASGIDRAVDRCVFGEPLGRIAPAYTNPNLMHAWLRGFVEPEAGIAHATLIAERVRRLGDVDEYNSPTYDGIDLFALALWVQHPPAPEYVPLGEELLDRLCARISALYHPGLAAVCGPHVRAYGLDLQSYVSLLGIWLAIAGEPPARVLPPRLSEHTDHVHDLFFLPVFERVRGPVVERLRTDPVDEPRAWRQEFGTAVANSVMRSDRALGWEHGRRPTSSASQYVPFVAHVEHVGRVATLGLMLPDGTGAADCVAITPDRFQVMLHAEQAPVGIRVLSNEPFTPVDDGYRTGPYLVTLAPRTSEFAILPVLHGFELRAAWAERTTALRITIER